MKIVATSDLHLGMKFSAYPEVKKELISARFEALSKIISHANEWNADLLIVAGDLFDRPGVSEATMERCASILGGFGGAVVAVLPGNHDYYSGIESAPWALFSSKCESARCDVLLLIENRPYDLSQYDLNAIILPGVCTSRHSDSHAIGWIDEVDGPEFQLTADRVESPTIIGVAHGSVEGISPDLQGFYYPMGIADFRRTPAQLWIVGHTHAQERLQTRPGQELFIPGTPEPDGFDCQHPGMFWDIETEDGRILAATGADSGIYRFVDLMYSVQTVGDLNHVDAELASIATPSTLLRITIDGTLSADAYERFIELRSKWTDMCFYFRIDDSGIVEELTKSIIDERFPEGSFPNRLLSDLVAEEDREAVRIAVDTLDEARERHN